MTYYHLCRWYVQAVVAPCSVRFALMAVVASDTVPMVAPADCILQPALEDCIVPMVVAMVAAMVAEYRRPSLTVAGADCTAPLMVSEAADPRDCIAPTAAD